MNKTPSRKLSSFFILLHLFFGYNCGFLTILSNRIQIVVCFISKLSILFIISLQLLLIAKAIEFDKAIYQNVDFISSLIYFFIYLFQYLCYLLVFTFAEYKIYDFLIDINKIQDIRTHINGFKVSCITAFMCVLGLIIEVSICMVYCRYGLEPCYRDPVLPDCVYVLATVSVDILQSVQATIMIQIYIKIKRLRIMMEYTEISIIDAQNYYIRFMDCCDKIRAMYNKFVILVLFMDTPKLMSLLWFALNSAKVNPNFTTYAIHIVYLCNMIMQIFLPSFIVQLVSSQVTGLKLVLNSYLMNDRVKKNNVEVLRFLRYLKSRNPTQSVWGTVPVDLKLPLVVYTFCVTYIIVLIQLTHLFD